MSDIINDVQRRHDFVLLFDVQDGNPNGDPDAGNLPRVDPETMHGLVTDVCLKRKIRNYVDAVRGSDPNYKIYVQNSEALNTLGKRAYDACSLKSSGTKQKRQDVEKAREWMCKNFYDVRTFGAVMTLEYNCGQVRGPIQMTFGRSIDPIVPAEVAITRIAITRPEDMEYTAAEGEHKEKGGKVTEMGRKALVPYGLYRTFGFFNPLLAEKTSFTSDDLVLFWQALQNMFTLDRSASRGLMACRALFVFSHECRYGNAPAELLFTRVTDAVCKVSGVQAPRGIHDYLLPELDELQTDLPAGVTLTSLVALPARVRAAGA